MQNVMEIPVTKLIPVGVLDTDKHLVMRVSTITAEVSGLETSSYSNNTINAHVDIQLLVKNYRRSMTVCCFGLCGLTDRLN